MFKNFIILLLVLVVSAFVFVACESKEETSNIVSPVVEEDVSIVKEDVPMMEEETLIEEGEPTNEVSTPDNVEVNIEDEIKTALLAKYPDWDASTLIVTVNQSDNNFVSGGVSFGPDSGGGYLYAVNVNDEWVIVADGNGVILCSNIEPFNFPTSYIPECWDDVNNVQVIR